jgi:hypothetical protein
MSHHSSEPNEAQRLMREMLSQTLGEYPQGRLNADDAGALPMAISQRDGAVVIDFPKPVAWIGFTPDDAMQIAQLLMKHAREIGITKPAVIRL